MKSKNVKIITTCSMIAAIYAALTFCIAPLSFSVFQFRISEALTILPLFTPLAIPGLFVGCLISNILGVVLGQVPIWDVLFGSFSTLGASICTYMVGKISLKPLRYSLAPLFPVLFNGIIVGYELTLFYGGILSINILTVSFGELVVCYLLGGGLIYLLDKNSLYKKIFNIC